MKNEILEQLAGMARKAQVADEERLKEDYGKLSDALDAVEAILSRHQNNQTLGMAERRLRSLHGHANSLLSISRAISA